jgi:hypothetical protein
MQELQYFPLKWHGVNDAPDMDFEFVNRLWVTQSKTCPEVLHRLHLLKDGRGFCTCEDFKYRGQKIGKPCKHLRAANKQKHIIREA